METLTGRVVVTGAASGIGRALAARRASLDATDPPAGFVLG